MLLRLLLLCCLLTNAVTVAPARPATAAAWHDWNTLQRSVRDGSIPPKQARTQLVVLHRRLQQAAQGKKIAPTRQFPVVGYDPSCIGGTAGSGYRPAGYDFYAGNRHRGHPAHDLFIRDSNNDGLDDTTTQPVTVVAFSGGIVTAVNPVWDYPSPIRGGIYVWVYSPDSGHYCYYAHLSRALVAPGDWLQPGQTIGLLGRTGSNAWAQRSPSHLHFMCLAFDRGRMTPVDTYQELLEAGRR